MNVKRAGRCLCHQAALVCLLAFGSGGTGLANSAGGVLLYDGALATTPAAQGWFSAVPPLPFASQSLSAGGVTLDTSFANATQAGYARAPLFSNAVTLDSGAGFRLSFAARLESESHASDNRAGFSVIVLDSAHRGVELGFWTNRVFAQDLIGGSFVQAAAPERMDLDTTGFGTYSVLLHGGMYTLSANGGPSFSGTLRDYSSSGVSVLGVPVYAQSNFLFFGDDTGSAAARMSLQSVSIAPVPEPSQAMLFLTGLTVIGFAIRRRRIKTSRVSEY
jgi:hypothetical protein